MKSIDYIINEIDPTQLYTPMQISQKKWLYGFNGEVSYYSILRLIKSGEIIAKNFGKGKTPYFRVLGKDLIKYTEKFK
jgi:hypothetical protein